MKHCRYPWIFAAVTLSLFCLVFLAPATEIRAMGQSGFSSGTATPSEAETAESEETAESTETDAGEKSESEEELLSAIPAGSDVMTRPRTRIATGSDILRTRAATGSDILRARIATGSDAPQLEVTRVISSAPDSIIMAERGRAEETVTQTIAADMAYGNAVVILSDRSRKIFPIEYDFDAFDKSQNGLTSISGNIMPKDGCLISPELSKVTVPVFLYDPKAPCEMPAVSVTPLYRTQIVLPESAGLRELEKMIKNGMLDDELYYRLEGGFSWRAAASWDFSMVNFGTPGIYKAIAQPELPGGILLPDSLSPDGKTELTCDIVIQEDGPLLLAPPEFTGLYMISQWTKETPDPEKFRCFYAFGNGEWIEDVDQKLIQIPRFALDYLEVYYYEDVFFETPYYFQISYDGEYSNILKVYFSEGQIHYRFYDGDRDGGDRGDQTAPDVSQTLPPETGPSGTEGTKPEETSPEETTGPAETPEETAPEETGPAETSPTEPSTSGHSSGGSHGSSGRHGSGSNSGNGSNHRDSTESSEAAYGPGYQMQAALSLPASLQKEIPQSAADTAASLAAAPTVSPEEAAALTDSLVSPETDPTASPKETADALAESSAAVEEDTADYTVLSGMRLKKYRKLHPGQPLLITKHQIQLEIPVEDSVFSDLKDRSLLRAELLSLSDDTIQVELSIDGVSVSSAELPELTVTMPRPASEESAPLQAVGPDGAVVANVQAADGSRITFTLKQTGTIRIQAVPGAVSLSETGNRQSEGPQAADRQPAPFLTELMILAILTVLAALLIPSGLFFMRRFGRRSGENEKKGGGKP